MVDNQAFLASQTNCQLAISVGVFLSGDQFQQMLLDLLVADTLARLREAVSWLWATVAVPSSSSGRPALPFVIC